MNDLRSRNRALAAVPDGDAVPTSTPPRVRPERVSLREPSGDRVGDRPTDRPTASRMSSRQSISVRAGREESEAGFDSGSGPGSPSRGEPTDDHLFRSSRPVRARDDSDERSDSLDAPDSRPSRRRDVPEDEVEEADRFPWHHQYHDDEPEEMQASTPLLSRAFRSSTG